MDKPTAKTYDATITETLQMTVKVEAENPYQAEQIVSAAWKSSEYILDYSHFIDVDVAAESADETI